MLTKKEYLKKKLNLNLIGKKFTLKDEKNSCQLVPIYFCYTACKLRRWHIDIPNRKRESDNPQLCYHTS